MPAPRESSGAFDGGQARPDGPRGRRLGVALGAVAAALVSAGLAFWIGGGHDSSLSMARDVPPPPPAPASASPGPPSRARAVHAPATPDAEQVARAYDQVQEIYADQGTSGVVSFAHACGDALRADPGVLDFCLAFDIYAAALDSDDAITQAWQAQSGPHDLALARSVLGPGQDPAARLAQVRALARQASLETAAEAEPNAPAASKTAALPPARTARPAAARAAAASSASHRAKTARSCRARATAAQRAICASPALRDADRRMRLAYRRATAAGASPSRLARDQKRFHAAVNAAAPNRSAMARLYHRRTLALEQMARRTKKTSG